MLSCSIFEIVAHSSGPEVAPDDVAAERQRQAVRPLEPPLAQVHDLVEPFGRRT